MMNTGDISILDVNLGKIKKMNSLLSSLIGIHAYCVGWPKSKGWKKIIYLPKVSSKDTGKVIRRFQFLQGNS